MVKNNNRFDIDMCKGPFFKKIIAFSLPLALTGILNLLYNTADIVVVGKFSDSLSLAAIGSTTALINLIINVFIGLSIGTSVAAAQYYGAKNEEKLQNLLHTSMLLSVISGTALGIFGFFASRQMLAWMDTPADVIGLAELYLKIYFIGMPFNMVYAFGAAVLRGTGDTRHPLYILTFSGIINVALNLVFVIVFKMNVKGVAIATIISQAVSALLIVLWLKKEKGCCRLYFKKLRIHREELLEIARIGLPAGFQGALFSISNVIIQAAVNSFGSAVMAGNAAAGNIEGFVYITMNSLSHASLTFTGQNYGAKKPENFNIILRDCLIIVTFTGLAMGSLAYIFGRGLLSIYTSDSDVIGYGIARLSVISTTYFLCGIMEVLVGQIRAFNRSIFPMAVSVAGVCALRIVWIYTVFAYFKTQEALYLSYPVSWLVTIIALFAGLITIRKYVYMELKASE